MVHHFSHLGLSTYRNCCVHSASINVTVSFSEVIYPYCCKPANESVSYELHPLAVQLTYIEISTSVIIRWETCTVPQHQRWSWTSNSGWQLRLCCGGQAAEMSNSITLVRVKVQFTIIYIICLCCTVHYACVDAHISGNEASVYVQ